MCYLALTPGLLRASSIARNSKRRREATSGAQVRREIHIYNITTVICAFYDFYCSALSALEESKGARNIDGPVTMNQSLLGEVKRLPFESAANSLGNLLSKPL